MGGGRKSVPLQDNGSNLQHFLTGNDWNNLKKKDTKESAHVVVCVYPLERHRVLQRVVPKQEAKAIF